MRSGDAIQIGISEVVFVASGKIIYFLEQKIKKHAQILCIAKPGKRSGARLHADKILAAELGQFFTQQFAYFEIVFFISVSVIIFFYHKFIITYAAKKCKYMFRSFVKTL